MAFTEQERAALYALFTIDEHEIREGSTSKDKKKIQFFTYVRREAIQARLDELFFGEWELYFLDPSKPAIYFDKHVDCSMGISIRGIRREYNGSQDGGGLNGAKGAATDAFKRVASMWGIGLYLQNSPQIWVENYVTYEGDKKVSTDWKKKDLVEKQAMDKVAAWLKSIGASGEKLFSEAPQEGEIAQENPNLDPDTHFGKKDVPSDSWESRLIAIKEITLPLYEKGVSHQRNSFDKAIREGLLTEDMSIATGASQIFAHRVFEDKQLRVKTEADLRNIMQAALGTSFSAYTNGKNLKEAFTSAWKKLHDYAAQFPE